MLNVLFHHVCLSRKRGGKVGSGSCAFDSVCENLCTSLDSLAHAPHTMQIQPSTALVRHDYTATIIMTHTAKISTEELNSKPHWAEAQRSSLTHAEGAGLSCSWGQAAGMGEGAACASNPLQSRAHLLQQLVLGTWPVPTLEPEPVPGATVGE